MNTKILFLAWQDQDKRKKSHPWFPIGRLDIVEPELYRFRYIVAANREQYDLMRDGVQVPFHNDKGERVRQRLKVFDFETPENNHFLCVRELWVRGDLYRR